MNPEGEIPVAEGVERMLKVIDQLTLQDSGKYVNNNGEAMPW